VAAPLAVIMAGLSPALILARLAAAVGRTTSPPPALVLNYIIKY
jgi:hypothetical protein